jgi:putative cardiolipin synthase
MKSRRAAGLAAVLVCMCACAELPEQARREPSRAILDTAQTRLGEALAPALAAHPGESGFYPIGQGADAFLARVGLARAADRTLDVQYYIFHVDDTGIALLGEMLAAADRGVRVRLLLDDIHAAGRDEALGAVDSHPNIEVRLFNPFAHRGARWIDLASDYGRVNRRMHNKSMTADSQLAVVGGRNVGDEYFAAGADVEFGDFDVLAAGPVVAQVSSSFDEYWNSDVAYPVSALLPPSSSTEDRLRALRDKVAGHTRSLAGTPYALGLAQTDLARRIAERKLAAYWGRAEVIADRPDKVLRPREDVSTHALPRLRKIMEEAKQELFLISPYFVPGDQGAAWLQDTARRGVRVRILTNSYAANDVGAVHAGYAAYRKALLESGVELYELKPTAAPQADAEGRHRDLGGSSRSSLHAKTYMADARKLFVGSFNLDPRSAFLNTEMGVVIESEALCAEFRGRVLGRLPDIAYRVELDAKTREVAWITRESGKETRYDSEPGVGLLQRMLMGLLRLLPIEEQL